MRLTATTLPTTMLAMATITVIGCRKAKRTGFMERVPSGSALPCTQGRGVRGEGGSASRGKRDASARDVEPLTPDPSPLSTGEREEDARVYERRFFFSRRFFIS